MLKRFYSSPSILINNTGRMLPPTERLKEGEGGRMLPVLTDEGVIHGAVTKKTKFFRTNLLDNVNFLCPRHSHFKSWASLNMLVFLLHTTLIKKKIIFSSNIRKFRIVAMSYMTNGLLINGEIFVHFLYFRKHFLIDDFATAPL